MYDKVLRKYDQNLDLIQYCGLGYEIYQVKYRRENGGRHQNLV